MSDNDGGFKISDLAGLGDGINKLLGVIEGAFGRATKAYFTKKDVDARAYEIRELAAAKADAMKVLANTVKEVGRGTGGVTVDESGYKVVSLPANENDRLVNLPSLQLTERVEDRKIFQEATRQQNIESVTAIAAEQLTGEKNISNKPVDRDWAARFFRYAEDVSYEEMQMIWGKLLAGEIKQPGSFSYRTMETIRSLSKDEADSFSRIASSVTRMNGLSYCLVDLDKTSVLENVLEHVKLNDAGLVSDISSKINRTVDVNSYITIDCEGLVVEAQNTSEVTFKVTYLPVTSVGCELMKLIKPKPDLEFMTKIATYLRDKGCRVRFGDVMEYTEGGMPKKFLPFEGWE